MKNSLYLVLFACLLGGCVMTVPVHSTRIVPVQTGTMCDSNGWNCRPVFEYRQMQVVEEVAVVPVVVYPMYYPNYGCCLGKHHRR